ncbi:hypothetical protein [Streptomyces sp. NPDC059134]|uniref:hypothetical protein n=1 Tax=Streptomyces sp. NPDC059134 TaxID=3346738 RepID=UPI0036C08F55
MGDADRAVHLVASLADLVPVRGDVAAVMRDDFLGAVQGVGRVQAVFSVVLSDGETVIPQVTGEFSQAVGIHALTVSVREFLRDMTTYDTKSIMRVAITGTRSTGHRSLTEYAGIFARYLSPFAPATSHFFIGGAKGIDSLSLVWLAGNTRAALTVVVPGILDQQPAEARQAVMRTRNRITDIVELGAAEVRTSAYFARNQWMVDHADMTIGFPLEGAPPSGTWQTLDYTADQGKPRLIVPV